ncbi:MAG: sulfatase-like hydrolase/transferase, partial [Chloroflexi bacterium]|nr:sulfatase-like hydrolase/transferase [Chloroflexota bacterium]
QLGITHMGVPVPEGTVTLPSLLRPYGYISANIGKLHFLPHANRDHRAPHPSYGFDHLEISDEPGCYEDAYRAWVRCKAPDQLGNISLGLPPATETWRRALGIGDRITHPAERFPKEARPFSGRSDVTHSAFVAEQTMEFIDRHRNVPFLCIAGFYSPHSPWVAPQEFLDRFDPAALTLPWFPPEVDAQRSTAHFSDSELRAARHGYYAMISEVDHHVGRILSHLDTCGLRDETIVIFTSDHGEWLGEHLRYGKGYPAPDCVSRVPLLVRWPEQVQTPGRTIDQIVEAVDVVPTLLEWVGVQRPPFLLGRPLPECTPPDGDRTTPEEASALTEGAGWKALRSKQFRYIAHSDGRELLFDLAQDPAEYHDVAADSAYRVVLAELRHHLLRRLLAMERPLSRTWSY